MLIILLAIYTLNIGFKNEIPKVVTPHLLVKQKGKISDTQVSYITYFDVWAFFCVLPLFFLILVWTVRTTTHNALTAQYNCAQGHRVDGEHGDGEDQEEDPALQLLLRPHRLCHLHRRLLDLCRRQYLLV